MSAVEGGGDVHLAELFSRLSDELRRQEGVARKLDEALGGLADQSGSMTDLQSVDALWQTLRALSVLSANAAKLTGRNAPVMDAHSLVDGVEMEAVRALVTQSDPSPDAPSVSLFL